jgi:predicted cobalt transporter CbtA
MAAIAGLISAPFILGGANEILGKLFPSTVRQKSTFQSIEDLLFWIVIAALVGFLLYWFFIK